MSHRVEITKLFFLHEMKYRPFKVAKKTGGKQIKRLAFKPLYKERNSKKKRH